MDYAAIATSIVAPDVTGVVAAAVGVAIGLILLFKGGRYAKRAARMV